MKRSNGKLKSSIESGKRNCPPQIRFRFTKPGYMEGNIFASSSTLTKNSSYWYVPNTKISQKMKKKKCGSSWSDNDLRATEQRTSHQWTCAWKIIAMMVWYIMYRDISRYQYLSIQRHLALITTSCFSFMPYVFSLALRLLTSATHCWQELTNYHW